MQGRTFLVWVVVRILALAVLAFALPSGAPAFAQVDNLNDRNQATDKEREQIIQQLVKTDFIDRVDVHGGHGNVYVGYGFYNPHLVRSELVRYIRIIAGYFGKAELDYMTPLFDGRVGIRIGKVTGKGGLDLELPPALANRPHRQPPPVVPKELPNDKDQLLEVIVNWFESSVLWKYDDSEPDRPKLYVSGATFFDEVLDHHQRKTILETAAKFYGGILLFYDNETEVQFGIYTKEKGLVLNPPPALARHFGSQAHTQPNATEPKAVTKDTLGVEALIAKWFATGVFSKLDQSDPAIPKIYVGPNFYNRFYNHYLRRSMVATIGQVYGRPDNDDRVVVLDNATGILFGAYTRKEGLLMVAPHLDKNDADHTQLKNKLIGNGVVGEKGYAGGFGSDADPCCGLKQ